MAQVTNGFSGTAWPGAFRPSFRVDVALEPPGEMPARVMLHHGTAETAARIARAGDRFAQLRLSRPVVAARGDRVVLRAGTQRVDAFCKTFGAAPSGVCFAYFGSSGYIELGMNQQSAAALLGVSPADSIILEMEC